jgi:hypothetical protein
VDDADVITRDESIVSHITPMWSNMNDTQDTEQSIIDFLRKPIVVAQSNFSITDTFSILNSQSYPFSAFNATQGPMWVDKLKGYFGIRMDMRFRLVVNANKFQQGRYCMGWVPLGGITRTTSNFKATFFNNMHMATLIQRTTVPHVEIDIATQTACELLVPFAAVQNFWPLNQNFNATDSCPLGFMNVYPYSPLVSPTGSTTASYTLYVSFENIKLFGAASPTAGLQDKEVTNTQNGPISGIARSFARGFQEFSNIPLLGEYALTMSWVSDRVARTAAMFGFSKPTQGDSLQKVEIINNPSHSNIDGDADVRALSYLSKPGTIPLKGLSGTDFDEMDFSYIIRKYANYATFSWNTGNLAAVTLYADDVHNNKFVNNAGVISWTPVSFVSNFFNLWRGSLKFRFKFVKTEFHSGRLEFVFYPTDDLGSLTNGPHYVNRLIVDIREHMEIELIIPYISRYPYMQLGEKIGVLEVNVVDPLIAPASVSSSVTVLVEIAGGDDFELAEPSNFTYTPKLAVPTSGIQGDDKSFSMTIGNSSINTNPIAASATCIGDKISSFRPMLKRFTPVLPNGKLLANTYRAIGPQISVQVDALPMLAIATPTDYTVADSLTAVASCYMFWTGGVRIKDIISYGLTKTPSNFLTSSTTTASLFTIAPSGTQQKFVTNFAFGTGSVSVNSHQVYQQSTNNTTLTVEVPQYTRTIARNIADMIIFQDSPLNSYNAQQLPSATLATLNISPPVGLDVIAAPVNGYDLHNIYRAMADDGNFSLFISVPPMVASPSTGLYGVF